MPYIHHNRRTDKLTLFSTMRAVSQNTDIKLDAIKYNLSRLKKESFEIEGEFKLIKTKLIRAKPHK